MSKVEDFKNAPVGATATHALWSRAMKIDDGEQCWFTPGGNRYNNGGMVFWNYTLDAPAPTSAREALDLAWDLAHEVKEGQIIPTGTRYLRLRDGETYAYIATGDILACDANVQVRTLEPLPDPEPDWLDAPAVLAVHDSYTEPSVWGKHWDQEGSDGQYQSAVTAGSAHWSELRDVTPLWPEGKTHE